jgi:hypothetical protein
MPLHDWTPLADTRFRDFHNEWLVALKRTLNERLLPPDYYAAIEQITGGYVPDVLTLNLPADWDDSGSGRGVAVLPRPAATAEVDRSRLPVRTDVSLVVRHVSGDRPVAVIEVVSPSNKRPADGLADFVRKTEDLLREGTHLLVLDVLPPGRHDPNGIHGAIWRGLFRRRYTMPTPGQRTFAAYESDRRIRAYVEHRAVGQDLPDVPLFLDVDRRITVPLEETYRLAYAGVPAPWRRILEGASTPAG